MIVDHAMKTKTLELSIRCEPDGIPEVVITISY